MLTNKPLISRLMMAINVAILTSKAVGISCYCDPTVCRDGADASCKGIMCYAMLSVHEDDPGRQHVEYGCITLPLGCNKTITDSNGITSHIRCCNHEDYCNNHINMTNFTIDQPSPTTIYSHDPTLHPSSNATNPCATHTCNIWFILTWVALPLVFIVNFTLCCLFVVQVAMYSHKKRKLHRQQINNLSDSVVFL